MKALVGAFNQEKALVGAFSVIVQPIVKPMEHYTALLPVVVLDVLGLDGQGRHEHHQEEDVEEGEDVVRRAKVAPVLQLDE